MNQDRGAIGSGSDRSQNQQNFQFGQTSQKLQEQLTQQGTTGWDKFVVLGIKDGQPHLITSEQDERSVTEMIRKDYPAFSRQLETS
jgi:hypothetical protein